MTATLRQFLEEQLTLRGETADQFSKRAGLNSSGLYQILRGERAYVHDRTLDKIAFALGMDLAQMFAAMGRAAEPNSDEVELLALYRQVPPEKKPQAKEFVGYLAVNPTQRRSNGRTDVSSKRLRDRQAQLERGELVSDPEITDGALGHQLETAFGRLFHAVGALASPGPRTSVYAPSL